MANNTYNYLILITYKHRYQPIAVLRLADSEMRQNLAALCHSEIPTVTRLGMSLYLCFISYRCKKSITFYDVAHVGNEIGLYRYKSDTWNNVILLYSYDVKHDLYSFKKNMKSI